jgi:hypothetical protein
MSGFALRILQARENGEQMKIVKLVSVPDVEVEIEISGEEAVNAILGDQEGWTPRQLLMRAVNNLASFFKKLPDTIVAELNSEQRKLITDFFEDQARRFRQ